MKLPSVFVLVSLMTMACGSYDSNNSGDGAFDWQSITTVASGDGHRGPWQMNESEFFYVDDPGIALAAGGEALVVWVDNRAQTVFLNRFDADGNPRFGQAVAVSASPDVFSWLPRLATLDGGQTVLAAWEEILFTGGSHGGEILLARSSDGGASFAEPVNLSNTSAGAGKGRLSSERWDNGSLDILARDGQVWVVWTEYEGALRLVHSDDGGQNFSEPAHVAGSDEQPARGPTLALLGDGRLLLAWTFGEAPSANIELAISADNGYTFEQLGAVHERPGHADAPRLAVDAQGTVHLVYAESADGPETPGRLVYAASPNSSPDFGPARVIRDLRADDRAYAGFPDIAVVGDDVIVTWEILSGQGRLSLGLGIKRSHDRGASFSKPELVPGTGAPEHGFGGGLQGLLMRKLATGPDGTLAVVHSLFVPDQASEIVLIRGQLKREQGDTPP